MTKQSYRSKRAQHIGAGLIWATVFAVIVLYWLAVPVLHLPAMMIGVALFLMAMVAVISIVRVVGYCGVRTDL